MPTLEPGLYDPDPADGFGIRLEDVVHLDDAGAENLTPLPESFGSAKLGLKTPAIGRAGPARDRTMEAAP